VQVELLGRDREAVSPGPAHQPLAGTVEHSADAGEMGVQRAPGVGRRPVAPHPVDEGLDGHRPPGVHDEGGQDRPLPGLGG
jgi:hypothetical protein